jgi:hypothetical protein
VLCKAIYKKQSHGQKIWEREGRNRRKHVLKGGYILRNLKTLMKTRFVIMVENTLKLKEAIILCYEYLKTIILQEGNFLKVEVWVIAKTLTNVLNCVVTTYVMKSNHEVTSYYPMRSLHLSGN